MLKEYKYYSVSINLIDRRGRPFRVKVVIDNRSAFNLIYLLLVN